MEQCELCPKYPVEIEDGGERLASLRLNVEEWAAIAGAIRRVPEAERDPQLRYAAEGVEHLLGHVGYLRDAVGDAKGVEEPVCQNDGCGSPIARGGDYVFEGSTGRVFHILCWPMSGKNQKFTEEK
jgi:hypothetical protein